MVDVDVFTNEALSKEKSKHLAKDYDNALVFEKNSVSNSSPGVVKNSEYLARQIFSPIHIDLETNEIKPGAFDDVLSKGMSTNRLYIESEKTIHSYGEAKAEKDKQLKPDREYHGFITANAGDIRSCVIDPSIDKQIFAIYDTSRIDAISHADVCAIASPKFNRSQKIEIRKVLRETFSKLKNKNQFS